MNTQGLGNSFINSNGNAGQPYTPPTPNPNYGQVFGGTNTGQPKQVYDQAMQGVFDSGKDFLVSDPMQFQPSGGAQSPGQPAVNQPMVGQNVTQPQGGSVNVGPNGQPNGVNIPGVQYAGGAQGFADLNPAIGSLLQGIMGGPQQVGNSGFQATQANLSGVPNSTNLTPGTSQGFDAISSILQRQFDRNIADTRERALDTGTSRSTGAGVQENDLRAAQLPQLAAALQQVRQGEVGNQLNQAGLQQQGLLANAGLANQYGLGGAQLDIGTQLQNVANILQNQGQVGGLLTGQLGQTGQGLQNNQFNAQQGNAYNLAAGGMNQQAAQQSIQNQLQSLLALFSGGLGLASQGIPTGGANVNIGNAPNNNNVGSTLGGIGSILSAMSGFGGGGR